MNVLIVQHVHEFEDGDEDVKFIGVFSNQERANEAIAHLRMQPGFKETSECFCIDEYLIDEINWAEGFLTSKPI